MRDLGATERRALFERATSADDRVRERTAAIVRRVRDEGDRALRARGKRYLMANVPRQALDQVKQVLPGLNGPTVIDILNGGSFVAVHAVVPAKTIYRTISALKALGGEGILVTRIERLMP